MYIKYINILNKYILDLLSQLNMAYFKVFLFNTYSLLVFFKVITYL